MKDALSNPPEFNPPEGWRSEPPPDANHEDAILREEFGDPVNGIYAPYVEG